MRRVTLTDLRARVRREYDISSSAARLPDTVLDPLINEAIYSLSGMLVEHSGQDFLTQVVKLTTTAGSSSVSLASQELVQILKVSIVLDGRPYQLRRASIERMDLEDVGEQVVYSPSRLPCYRMMGTRSGNDLTNSQNESIYLWPAPAQDYDVRVWAQYSLLELASGDYVHCRPNWDKWIVKEVLVELDRRDKRDDTPRLRAQSIIEDRIRKQMTSDAMEPARIRETYQRGADLADLYEWETFYG